MKGKSIIILVSIIALLAGGFFIGTSNGSSSDENEVIKTMTIDLEEMVVKLSDSKYIKTNISLEYDEDFKDIESKISVIRDTLIGDFISKQEKNFDHKNIESTKEEIKLELNEKLGTDVIQNVYFTNLVVQ